MVHLIDYEIWFPLFFFIFYFYMLLCSILNFVSPPISLTGLLNPKVGWDSAVLQESVKEEFIIIDLFSSTCGAV